MYISKGSKLFTLKNPANRLSAGTRYSLFIQACYLYIPFT
jgi:hypothetical protein